MPAISVMIPTYNHEQFVVSTLESVFSQSFRDYEVIVVNDGSTAKTALVLSEYIQSGRISYIEQANAGQAAARNRGLAEAQGEFIAFLDDDDLWPRDKLEWQVQSLSELPTFDAVGGTYTTELEMPQETVSARSKVITHKALLSGNAFISPGQLLFRTKALCAVGGFNTAIWGADDYDLYLRLTRDKPILCSERLALHYRIHNGNASNNLPRMLENLQRCLFGHLEEVDFLDRVRYYHAEAHWLYSMYGRRILASSYKSPLRSRALCSCGIAQKLWRWLLANPRALAWFLREAIALVLLDLRPVGR